MKHTMHKRFHLSQLNDARTGRLRRRAGRDESAPTHALLAARRQAPSAAPSQAACGGMVGAMNRPYESPHPSCCSHELHYATTIIVPNWILLLHPSCRSHGLHHSIRKNGSFF